MPVVLVSGAIGIGSLFGLHEACGLNQVQVSLLLALAVGACYRHESRRTALGPALGAALACLCVVLTGPLQASTGNTDDLIQKYENLLLLTSDDYEDLPAAKAAVEGHMLGRFRRAVRRVESFAFASRGQLAYFTRMPATEAEQPAEDEPAEDEPAEDEPAGESNSEFHRLFNDTALSLAYAYHTPGTADRANPYYQDAGVLQQYVSILDYAYSRGLTEDAWLPDHAGIASARAIERGLERTSGDFSQVSLRFAGFIQSVFLMREALAEAGLLAKYRAVVRNLVVNCGVMYAAFSHIAREDAGVSYPDPLPIVQQYHLNADGMRLFVDYFWPYYLLIDDVSERSMMAAILYQVVDTNIAVKPGTYGTIKPDGAGFHHHGVYASAYAPHAFEVAAQLLYLLKGTTFYRTDNVDAIKLALEAYRVMVQRYSSSFALRGRFVGGDAEGRSRAIAKAMAYLAHPDGADDMDMKARFLEFFDPEYFFSEERRQPFSDGSRGLAIQGMGVYRLIADLQGSGIEPSEAPTGVWIKPYAAAGFLRRGDWLVTAKGFSQYLWNYENEFDNHENSFGQNWAYGSLMVFSAGTPVSDLASGYALFSGWDWYHVPGTTASHYAIERHSDQALKASRREQEIQQRDTHRNYNTRTYVGGVSLGDHGFFVQDLEAVPFTAPTDLRGWKSYFFVGDQVLALGSHIRGGTADDETHTTIFQTYLEDSTTATQVNGEQLTGLETMQEHSAGTSVKLTDSVGNSFYLAASTADLMVTRNLQQSMSLSYEATEGAFATAYLDHGIKPDGDSYEYVVIPADADATKLDQVAADPSAYYQVLDSTRMHLVRFPQHDITAYAFYEAVETPEEELVRAVNQPAAVIIQEQEVEAAPTQVDEEGQTQQVEGGQTQVEEGGQMQQVEGGQMQEAEEGQMQEAAAEPNPIRLVASVPDIGWQFDPRIYRDGLNYASRHFAFQRAREHTLRLVLRGNWCPDESTAPFGSEWISLSGQTLLQLPCSDGLATEILLRACPTAPEEPEVGMEGMLLLWLND
ncbi:MAG: hypothetical protein F4X12_02215 [Acidobacteriia bacterium]|nr:hypothetical protein [Terriglobia bacterium]